MAAEVRKCRTCNKPPQGPAFANCADCARKFLQRLNDRWPGFAPCYFCYGDHSWRVPCPSVSGPSPRV